MDVTETNIPRYAIFRGRKVRITQYWPKDENLTEAKFMIVDTDDTVRFIWRSQIDRFVK